MLVLVLVLDLVSELVQVQVLELAKSTHSGPWITVPSDCAVSRVLDLPGQQLRWPCRVRSGSAAALLQTVDC